MTSATFEQIITADGEYVFPTNHVLRGILEIVGTFAGATAYPGYDDGAGNFVSFFDGSGDVISALSSAGWEVFIPASGRLAVKITGDEATTSLKVLFTTP